MGKFLQGWWGTVPFLHAPWLLKDYPDTTKNRKERYFIRILRSDRVVSEHALGMLKGRFCIVYKKAKCPRQCKSCYHRLYCTWEDFVLYTKRQNIGDNVKAVIIACIALHNFCILVCDLCLPHWQLRVERLILFVNPPNEPRMGS